MLYDYRCQAGHVYELVRPLGTDFVACPACGAEAERSHVHMFDVVGPTVDTRGMSRRFLEALREREHGFKKAEAEVGHPIPRPNDWAVPKAKAAAKLKHGELDVKNIRRHTKGEFIL